MRHKRRPEMQRAKITNGAPCLPPPSSPSSPLPSVLLPCVYTTFLPPAATPPIPPLPRVPPVRPAVHPQQVAALHPPPDKCELSADSAPGRGNGIVSAREFASRSRHTFARPQTSRRIKIIYSKARNDNVESIITGIDILMERSEVWRCSLFLAYNRDRGILLKMYI